MPAPPRILGLHHVTAIASDAQKNVDFYAGVLGLKLVKINVNQDDPTSLHLYYGDERASPGSLVTFFVYPGMEQGKPGLWPQVPGLEFNVGPGSLPAWERKLQSRGLSLPTTTHTGFLHDPDGLPVLLHDHSDAADFVANRASPGEIDFSPPRAIDGIGQITLRVEAIEPTLAFVQRWLGYDLDEEQSLADVKVLRAAGEKRPLVIDATEEEPGNPGAGTVHHVAFRIATDDEQAELHARLTEAGVDVSPVIDRFYFKSIYFREPGGILLEVATDGPGFAVDEPPDRLGRTLCLPPWLEPRRAEIERAIPRLTLPTGETIGGR